MRKLWMALIIMLLLVVVGGGFVYWASSRTSDGLRHVLETRRAAGEPLTFAEIQALRTPITGEGETVADVVSRIAEAVEASPGPSTRRVLGDGDGALGEFFDGIPSEEVEPSRKYLDARRPAMQGLDSIGKMETGRFGISYDGDFMTAFVSQGPPLLPLLKLLSLDATLNLIDRDVEAAAAFIPLYFRIISPLEQEPDMLAQVIRMSAVEKSINTIESALRVGALADATLKRMDEEFRGFLASYSMKWSLWGERAGMLVLLDQFFGKSKMLRAVVAVVLSGDKSKGVEFLNSLIDAKDDPAELLRAAENIKTELTSLSRRYMVTSMTATALPRCVRVYVESLADVRAIRLLIAVERFRLRNETLPTALEELVPTYIEAIPIDPFDRTPLKSTHRDGMFIVYSVGKDGVDDGGQVVPVEGEKRARDRGFRLLPVSDRGVVFRDEANSSDEP